MHGLPAGALRYLAALDRGDHDAVDRMKAAAARTREKKKALGTKPLDLKPGESLEDRLYEEGHRLTDREFLEQRIEAGELVWNEVTQEFDTVFEPPASFE